MYLSRVEIDSGNRRKIRDLSHAGAYHSWVEECFQDEVGKENRSRKLWRIDTLQGKNWLMVVSREKPELLRLEKYGVPGTAQTKDYELLLNRIRNGQRCRFRVVLNPVHSVPQGQGSRGRVYPEVTAERQLAFLEKRASDYGFDLVKNCYDITERSYVILKKSGMKPVHLCKVTYEGELIITDEGAFRNVLVNGMGRKKAYGFGMMTVIPINEQVY